MSKWQHRGWFRLAGTHPGSRALTRVEVLQRRRQRVRSRAQQQQAQDDQPEDSWFMGRGDHYYVAVAGRSGFRWELRGPAVRAEEREQHILNDIYRQYPNV